MFKSANQHPSGSEATSGLTGASSFSLESALDHPLSGYVILPVAGAAIGAATHPLQALRHRAFHSEEDRREHPWQLRHSALVGTGIDWAKRSVITCDRCTIASTRPGVRPWPRGCSSSPW